MICHDAQSLVFSLELSLETAVFAGRFPYDLISLAWVLTGIVYWKWLLSTKLGETMSMKITLPSRLFEHIAKYAGEKQRSPEEVAVDALSKQFLPQHPYIEHVVGSGGVRAVVKGTRTGVEAIIGYTRAGYTPQDIAGDILPHLTLAEIYDALSYYEDYRDEIDAVMAANEPEAWRNRLINEMGDLDARKLLGEL